MVTIQSSKSIDLSNSSPARKQLIGGGFYTVVTLEFVEFLAMSKGTS